MKFIEFNQWISESCWPNDAKQNSKQKIDTLNV